MAAPERISSKRSANIKLFDYVIVNKHLALCEDPRALDHVFGIGEKQLEVVALRRK
jgi:hypothetical protein